MSKSKEDWQISFNDRKLEWRRLFSEILGTFFLVLVAVGSEIIFVLNSSSISSTAIAVAPGLMVMAIILFMGKVSGGKVYKY